MIMKKTCFKVSGSSQLAVHSYQNESSKEWGYLQCKYYWSVKRDDSTASWNTDLNNTRFLFAVFSSYQAAQ